MKKLLLLAQSLTHTRPGTNHLTSACLVFTACKIESITIQASSFPLSDILRTGEMLSWKWLEHLRTGLSIQKRCCSQVVLQLLFFSMKGRYCKSLLAKKGSCCCVLTQWYNKQEGRHLKRLMALISFIEFLLPHLKPQSPLFFMDRCFFLSNFPQLPGHLEKNKADPRHKYIFPNWIIDPQGEHCFLRSHLVHSI